MSEIVASVVAELLARHRASGRVELDDIEEVVGDRPVSYEEVDAIIGRLENEGLRVGEPLTEVDVATLQAVVEVARRLRGLLGRPPTVTEIARESQRPSHTVRRALEHVQRAGQPPKLPGQHR
ncbi:sigma-70 domain-containing protein [Chondromyces apiculatus]|uniref:RNA polymerase sigma-70 region 3 domain-containing protein n=1 Tax=Chondromyces apiculatus DSM 436 TaxID=1192034 RepID=A0A017TIA9_9BACT|nr:sigma-70 domain-containing protein [Chondromyces apiculatus]EYF08612.1 Hypothetical protein CAP_4142 [Chondromyces apiculatus DSM 436]